MDLSYNKALIGTVYLVLIWAFLFPKQKGGRKLSRLWGRTFAKGIV